MGGLKDLLIAFVLVTMISIGLSNFFMQMGNDYSFPSSNFTLNFTERVYNQSTKIYYQINSTQSHWIQTIIGVLWTGTQLVIGNFLSVFDMMFVLINEISMVVALPNWFVAGILTIAFTSFIFLIYNVLTGRALA